MNPMGKKTAGPTRKKMSPFLGALFFLISVSAHATPCGLYDFRGSLKKVGNQAVFLAFDETLSETKLTVDPKAIEKFTEFLDYPVNAKIKITSFKNHYEGKVGSIQSIQVRVPNLLMGASDHFLKLIHEEKCGPAIP